MSHLQESQQVLKQWICNFPSKQKCVFKLNSATYKIGLRLTIKFAQKKEHEIFIYDALRDLESFAQLTKREKYPWRSVTFSKVAG